MNSLILSETIINKIYFIRGKKVMLDTDLASLYKVKTKTLNQAVKRNIKRFPADFMFQLNWKEIKFLRSQIVTLNLELSKRGKHIKYLPYAFTEQGVAMLSSVLKSEQAIEVNIQIMRVFTKLRRILSTHKALARKLNELENKFEKHDVEITAIFEAIREFMKSPEKPPKRKI